MSTVNLEFLDGMQSISIILAYSNNGGVCRNVTRILVTLFSTRYPQTNSFAVMISLFFLMLSFSYASILTSVTYSFRMAMALLFDGHVRQVEHLGLDFFLTFTLASATELPADTLLTFTLDRWGRRWYACVSLILSGVFSLLSCSVETGM